MRKIIKRNKLKVQIAKGNSKIGLIPTISLPPILACRQDAPCKADCYALKAWRQYTRTRQAWSRNYQLATTLPSTYFDQINNYLIQKTPRFFRWHTSGDILDQSYLDWMVALAKNHPSTNFLCFTKMYELDFKKAPTNLRVVFSMWPCFKAKGINKSMPKAYMLDDANPDSRVPADVRPCPGHCDTCGMCWSLKQTESVVFNKH